MYKNHCNHTIASQAHLSLSFPLIHRYTRLILATCREQLPASSQYSERMRSAALPYAGGEYHAPQSYFLEACSLCQKPLGHNSDIFMYRGNTPFCSQECRQEQMEIDDAKEKSWKRRAAALRQTTKTAESSKKPSAPKQTGTVAVA